MTMPNSRKLPQRFAGLTIALSELNRSLPTNAPRQPKLERERTIRNLLGRLDVFGRNQIEFFQASIKPDHPLFGHPISETEAQIGNDLEVIERTADQRMRDAPPDYREALVRADALAYAALHPAKKAFSSPDDQTALTYFQKAPAIRVIPYAPVALIGIPFTTLKASHDYLATPHEVGHYVYWHGRVPKKRAYGVDAGLPLRVALLRRLQTNLKRSRVRKWVEEVFADVYCCAIGGPVMAIDFQDLQLNRSYEEFVEDDGEHPIPLIRPDVRHRVLEKMGLAEYADAARVRWEELLKGRGEAQAYKQMANLRATLEEAVDEVWALLEPLYTSVPPGPGPLTPQWPIPYGLPRVSAKLDHALYRAFDHALDDFDPARQRPGEIKPARGDPNLDRLQETFIRDAKKTAALFGLSKSSHHKGLAHDILAVLGAGGWTTGGPQHAWP
jgi:hypothetical protein